MKNRGTAAYSIKIRIAFALFVLVALQGMILLLTVTASGTIRRNDTASYSILSNQASSRRNEVAAALNTKRVNVAALANELAAMIDAELNIGVAAEMALTPEGGEIWTAIQSQTLDGLISFSNYNAVTGVFAVFDASEEQSSPDKARRSSIHVRNSAPGLITGNNSNLLLEYGDLDAARRKGIAVDYLWSRDMDFTDGFNREFYFKPIIAAAEVSADLSKPQLYGYWDGPFRMRKDDLTVITYSMPLVLLDGTVAGIIGFELETAYIASLVPALETPYESGFYLIGRDSENGELNADTVVPSGPYAHLFLAGAYNGIERALLYENDRGSVYRMNGTVSPGNTAIGAFCEIRLYENNSPFIGERWLLVCAAPEASVLSGSRSIRNAITISVAATVFLALLMSLFVMTYISKPIGLLYDRVRSIDPEKPVRFERTGMREIDELSGAFEVLSDGVSEAAAKMLKIIELVDMPIGSFEINYRAGVVRLSRTLFGILGINPPDDGSSAIPVSEWKAVTDALTVDRVNIIRDADEIIETLCSTGGISEGKKWYKIRRISENARDIGVLIDVTDETLQKQRLEYERNMDSLTRLLNRQGFFEKAYELIKENPDKCGIVMFSDLDDLKFVNDSYGHETGDDYIKVFADFLRRFVRFGAAVGRISGDEFVIFMTGFDSRSDAKAAFDAAFEDRKGLSVMTPDGSPYRLRSSVGIAYYPDDSDDIKLLVKYADYAMYEVKHSNKGEIREFNIGSYNKNSFVINMKNILNLFIEEKRVHFAFQPIVDAQTGEVFAYEALMRSMMQEMKSASDILKVARSQAKLYQVEKLTFDVVFDWISRNSDKIEDKKIFINTMPGQNLQEGDMQQIYDRYGQYFSRVVFEITEDEMTDEGEVRAKIIKARTRGAMIAIDDFGSGYSNEIALLFISPDFLKLDMSIVRGIDQDGDKRQLALNIISYAASRGIKVIAEGVETRDELETIIELGADYIQGFYLGRPNFEIIDIPEHRKAELVEISSKKG